MRSLYTAELEEVQGGRISGSLAVSIISVISDAWTLIEAVVNVNYQALGSGTSLDANGYNPMGDFTNGICAR
jgi:hypothetical protein